MVEAELFVDYKFPQLGLVPPSKEVSSVPNPNNRDGQSDLLEAIRNWPDVRNYFLAVYHHTILSEEMRQHSQPEKGETRYKSTTPFPDPFTLLSTIANAKHWNQLFTAVVVAPQMQTASLAQQVAAISNLSKGRFNLGVGVGWNESEYKALGVTSRFKKRGRILDQQIPALEMILAGRTVNLTIEDETIENMAINPPSHYRVPIWVGGLSDAALQRAATLADGWMPLGELDMFLERKPKLLSLLAENNRNLKKFGLMGRVTLGTKTIEDAVQNYIDWAKAGATHIAISTTGSNNSDPNFHSGLIYEFLKGTDWLRTPNYAPFGPSFGSPAMLPPNIFSHKKDDQFAGFKLTREPELLESYLKYFKFETVETIETLETNSINLPQLTPHPLKVVRTVKNDRDYVFRFLTTPAEPNQIYIVYPHSFDRFKL